MYCPAASNSVLCGVPPELSEVICSFKDNSENEYARISHSCDIWGSFNDVGKVSNLLRIRVFWNIRLSPFETSVATTSTQPNILEEIYILLHKNSYIQYSVFTRIYTTHSRTSCNQFWIYQAISNTLKMGKESVPETSGNFHTLTRLSAREQFIEFCRRKSFKAWVLCCTNW